jgi:hypothetical protein
MVNNGYLTLCFDIENVFLRKVDILNLDQLNQLRELDNYENYLVVDTEFDP